ncbi:MAG: MCP four helix bundle domain-containing protein, partial [Bacteroidota bacterium]
MNWFYNLKLSAKLILSFALVALISALVGYIGIRGLNEMMRDSDEIYYKNLLGIVDIATVRASVLTSRGDIRSAMDAKNSQEKNKLLNSTRKFTQKADEAIDRYEKTKMNDETKEYVEDFKTNWELYKEERETGIQQMMAGNLEGAADIFDGKASEHLTTARAALDKLIETAVVQADVTMKSADEDAGSAKTLLIIFIGIGTAVSVLLGLFVSRVIGVPINKLTTTADRISLGDVNVTIDAKTKDEIGSLERSFAKMIDNIKVQALAAEKIAQGDLNVELKAKSEHDLLSKSMLKVIDTLRNLVAETVMLGKSAVEGKLTTRGNAEKFQGEYKEIVAGVNATLDAVVQPINESSKVLEKIAGGDLTVRMIGEYKGDYKVMKDSINGLAESFGDALSDVAAAVQATASASSQISSSSEEMAAGAQEQSSQTTEVAGAVEEMTKTILETTKNSSNAAEAA